VECKIIDQNGHLVPHDTDGEICLRGYNIFQGYWDEPAKTAETIDKNGWLKTGDIGSMDHNGCVFFKSRQKEIIIRGGVNIYPAEIESFMRTHPDILDCYAFGLPDERVGEEVAIWIKLKPNTQNKVTNESILEFCKGKIAFFKTPKYIKFVDAFPINPNGNLIYNNLILIFSLYFFLNNR
jgi:fatty-acyl-CoA synthase